MSFDTLHFEICLLLFVHFSYGAMAAKSYTINCFGVALLALLKLVNGLTWACIFILSVWLLG